MTKKERPSFTVTVRGQIARFSLSCKISPKWVRRDFALRNYMSVCVASLIEPASVKVQPGCGGYRSKNPLPHERRTKTIGACRERSLPLSHSETHCQGANSIGYTLSWSA